MNTRWKQMLVLLALAAGSVGDAFAEWSLDLGVESFRWQEFDSGARLLEETGPRFRVGGTWRQPFGVEQRDLFQLRGAIYLGNVDYDGQACTLSGICSPFKSDAIYAGATVEATYARRFGAEPVGEFFVGGGTDSWRRDIKGSGGVSGAIEDWSVLYDRRRRRELVRPRGACAGARRREVSLVRDERSEFFRRHARAQGPSIPIRARRDRLHRRRSAALGHWYLL
jgi:hypothetical protein